MALPIWQRTITTEAGDVIPGAEVEVVNEATGLAADIFSNRAGTTPRSNPFFTGADGFAQFYVAPGEYRITATGPTGSITWRWNVLTGDAALMTNNTGSATLGTVAAQNANSVNISGGAISSTNVTAGTVNATTLQQGGSQAYVRSNIIGTVSQSGGVPTGAIIERGSNSNGEYVKFADGTLMQTVNIGVAGDGEATYEFNWDYPTPFFTGSTIPLTLNILSNSFAGGNLGDGRYRIESYTATSRNSLTTAFFKFTAGTATAVEFSTTLTVAARGRWY